MISANMISMESMGTDGTNKENRKSWLAIRHRDDPVDLTP